MKIWVVLILFVVAGMTLGVVLALPSAALFRTSDAELLGPRTFEQDSRFPPLPQPGEPLPRIVLKTDTYDFGAVEINSQLKHSFVVTNAGEGTLVLRRGETTCSCTISGLGADEVPPGESTEVTLEWTVKGGESNSFSQVATVMTNDPHRRVINFKVRGQRKRTVLLQPEKLSFSKPADETLRLETRLVSTHDEPVRIESLELARTDLADYFEIETHEMPVEQLHAVGGTSGYIIEVQIKPGLPIGPVDQQLAITTNLPSVPQLIVPVTGSIDSDIAIAGRDWNKQARVLRIGPVKSSAGATRRLLLTVRGPHRDEVDFRVKQVDSDVLQVSIGEPGELSGGRVRQFPLTIEVAAGARPVNHLGGQAGQFAEIVLETNHPVTPELTLRVQFAVEG